MSTLPIYILDKDRTAGNWVRSQLDQIGITVRWVASVTDLLVAADAQPPAVCLLAVRPPTGQALALIAELTQEPRFAQTAFIPMGPIQHKHAAFEAGADDYLITPPDVIELRKRVRLYLQQVELETRLIAEESLAQNIALGAESAKPDAENGSSADPVTLLEHAAHLTQERNLFDTILHHAGAAIALVAPDGTLRYANHAWQALVGRAFRVTVGGVMTWPPTTVQPEAARSLADAIAQAQTWHGLTRYTPPDAPPLVLVTTISPAFDAAGDRVGFVVIQADARLFRAP